MNRVFFIGIFCSVLSGGCGDIDTMPETDTPTALVNPIDVPFPDSDLTANDDAFHIVTRFATAQETAIYAMTMHALTDTIAHMSTPAPVVGSSAFHGVLRALEPSPTRRITLPCADGDGEVVFTVAGSVARRAIDATITASFAECAVQLTGSVTDQLGCTVNAQISGEITCTLQGASDINPLNLDVVCQTSQVCSGLQVNMAGSSHSYGTAVSLVYQKETSGVIRVQESIAPDGFACIDNIGLSPGKMLQLAELPAATVGCE